MKLDSSEIKCSAKIKINLTFAKGSVGGSMSFLNNSSFSSAVKLLTQNGKIFSSSVSNFRHLSNNSSMQAHWKQIRMRKSNRRPMEPMELWNNLWNSSRRLWNQIVCCSIKGMPKIKDLSLMEDIFRGPSINKIKFFVVY